MVTPRSSMVGAAEFAARSLVCHAWSMQGRARRRLEDAWAVRLSQRLGKRRFHVAGVFDGIGGAPGGDEASVAAAAALGTADSPDAGALLSHLNRAVRQSGGLTTALIALTPATARGELRLVWAGDSGAFLVRQDHLLRVTPPDVEQGRLTQYLGLATPPGHVLDVRFGKGESLLLTTDGAERALPERAPQLLFGHADPDAVFEELVALLMRGDVRDDATLVWIRPR